ncbi:hypothetical protein D3C87_2095100 [compost metagenome]
MGFNPKSATAYQLTGTNGWNSGEGQVKMETKAANLSGAYSFPAASVTILEVTP